MRLVFCFERVAASNLSTFSESLFFFRTFRISQAFKFPSVPVGIQGFPCEVPNWDPEADPQGRLSLLIGIPRHPSSSPRYSGSKELSLLIAYSLSAFPEQELFFKWLAKNDAGGKILEPTVSFAFLNLSNPYKVSFAVKRRIVFRQMTRRDLCCVNPLTRSTQRSQSRKHLKYITAVPFPFGIPGVPRLPIFPSSKQENPCHCVIHSKALGRHSCVQSHVFPPWACLCNPRYTIPFRNRPIYP